jgi:lipoic acid synthetase
MILGDTCSRNCGFCAITPGNPLPPDPDEPRHVAESVSNMKLRHVVITSVTRDDLSDGGAEHWAETIKAVKEMNPGVTVEILIPDFKGNAKLVKLVADAGPDIFNHNVETVPNLYSTVRPQANYNTSLGVLEAAKSLGMMTKTGFMVGLGEELEQIKNLMKDLRAIDVDILTIGQYLQPTQKHLPVVRYVHPDEFAEYKKIALEMGFRFVESAPLVRSSYHAERSL